MREVRFAVFLLVLGHASAAFAAGYGLKEYSAGAMASAYAGSAASDDAASDLAYNPASLDGVHDGDFSLSGIEILPNSSAQYPTALTSFGTKTGGDASPKGFIGDALVPALAARARLSDRWSVGLVVYAPWGLSTDYPQQWAGRYYARKTKLLTLNAAPTLAYRVAPWLSLGAGAQLQYSKGTLSSVIDTGTLGALFSVPGAEPGNQDSFATFNGDAWGFGYALGALAKPADGLTLGLSYRSAVRQTLSGPLTFALDGTGVGAAIRAETGLFKNTRASTALTTPDVVSFGGRGELCDGWTALFELDWTEWRKFQALQVVAANPAQPVDLTEQNWRNAWFGAVGLEYRQDESWSFRAGTAFDESPTPDRTRGPRIPDANRVWLAAGAAYNWNDATAIKFTAAHLFNPTTPVSRNPGQPGNLVRGTLIGTTSSSVNVLGIELDYRE